VATILLVAGPSAGRILILRIAPSAPTMTVRPVVPTAARRFGRAMIGSLGFERP
jgi:hypothetical protein